MKWAPKNWCFWTVVLEKTLESPLDCKEIQPVHSEGDQSWVFFGRNDAKAETPVLWPPHARSWLIGKDSDAGRGWGQEENDGGWDRWMASPTRWTWVWVNSGSWWWTGRPGVLQFMGSLRVGHKWDWTELNWTMKNNWVSEHLQIIYLLYKTCISKIWGNIWWGMMCRNEPSLSKTPKSCLEPAVEGSTSWPNIMF